MESSNESMLDVSATSDFSMNKQKDDQRSVVVNPTGYENASCCNDYDQFLEDVFEFGDDNNRSIISSSSTELHQQTEGYPPFIELYYDVPNSHMTQQQHPFSARLRSHSSSNMLLMRRVSSGFFSIGSTTGIANELADRNGTSIAVIEPTLNTATTDNDMHSTHRQHSNDNDPLVKCNAVDVLYHDIMMNVLSYLTLQDLSSYSQTAKRPNIDCCDYLQLQLELALLRFPSTSYSNNNMSNRGNSFTASILSRLASLDLAKAEHLVENFRTSVQNNTHNINYHHNFNNPFVKLQQKFNNASIPEKGAVATTMLGISMLGATAASKAFTSFPNVAPLLVAGSTACTSNSYAATTLGTACACVSFAAAASHYYSSHNDGKSSSSDNNGGTASSSHTTSILPSRMLLEIMAQKLQELLMTVPQLGEGEGLLPVAIATHLRRLQSPNHNNNQYIPHEEQHQEEEDGGMPEPKSSTNIVRRRSKRNGQQKNCSDDGTPIDAVQESSLTNNKRRIRRRPVGCAGIYTKALKEAKECIKAFIFEKRRRAFNRLSEDEQRNATTAFIDACSSDGQLELLKSLVANSGINVNGFYVGSDNAANNVNNNIASETCALHAAAFHGSTEILKFLCQGIATSEDDGGLCDVNIVDSNGWSALHFAAGCSGDIGVAVVQILAGHGCNLFHEAENGYTPYHWAQRLSNLAVSDELKRLGADSRFFQIREFKSMLMCSASAAIPLSIFANRVLYGNY